MQDVGIVVPTTGDRAKFLTKALQSIREAGDSYILLVGKSGFDPTRLKSVGLIDDYVEEQGSTLAAIINFGIRSLPNHVRYVNWLGDDDLLTANSTKIASTLLRSSPRTVLVYGGCDYIDSSDQVLFTNQSGVWAVPLLRCGPQLIPQPGALFRRSAFEEVGGLDERYGWAFDFDLFIKLSKIGKCSFVPVTLSKFRWHWNSLSVGQRKFSVSEASEVRVSHLPYWLKWMSSSWEFPIRKMTLLAGARVSKKYLSLDGG